MLAIRDVVGGYEDIQVLRGVSLDVRGGEIVGLLGPNGHGKSTLLKAIAGVHPATGGSIRFMDEEIIKAPPHRIVEAGIAYIPEERHLFSDMTVLENLQLGAYSRTARPEFRRNLELVFDVFPRLKERQRQVCMTMSGGESRMVAIARGLMSGARMLLIDEPSIGLAPSMKKAVYGAILRINQDAGITVLLVEQEIDYALRLTSRIYMMKRGAVQFERPSGEASVDELKEAYF
ncbi:MAG TPA: ABC transporter ATP-binding protein [Candidatus Limnocylindrales bacterium]|nr:ABC transporter ATP-binding protein [Candidatus Limnocylindrales bacterium]